MAEQTNWRLHICVGRWNKWKTIEKVAEKLQLDGRIPCKWEQSEGRNWGEQFYATDTNNTTNTYIIHNVYAQYAYETACYCILF